MLNKHVFKDISTVLDYVLVEEATELQNDELRQKTPVEICVNNKTGFCRAGSLNSREAKLAGFYNSASMDKFIMTRLASGRYCFKPNLKKRNYLFRGQISYYEPCTSGLFRDKTKDYYIAENILYNELFLLVLSHPLAQLWDLGMDLLGNHYRFEVNPYGLSQHYYNKTMLLDLTSDPEVAAFFATNRYDWVTDSYVPITDESTEGVLYCYSLDMMQSFKPDSIQTRNGQNLSTIGLQIFPRSEKLRGFLVVVPKGANFNEYPEVKAIKFKHNAAISQKYHDKFHGGKDLFPDDILMEHWKRENKDKKIVSEQSLKLNSKFNSKKSLGQLRQELLGEGFEIKPYQPMFTEEELEKYYSTAKDQWQQFCDKIHIPGDRDSKLKDALRNVPDTPQYKWAFEWEKSHIVNYSDGFLLRQFESCLK